MHLLTYPSHTQLQFVSHCAKSRWNDRQGCIVKSHLFKVGNQLDKLSKVVLHSFPNSVLAPENRIKYWI